MPGDAVAVLQNLRGADVLLAGDVRGLLQEWQVDVGLHVTLRSRISVPVPGAAEVAALLNDAKVVDARLGEPCAGDQAGESAADDGHPDIVRQGSTVERVGVGILQVGRDRSRQFDVLGVPVRPKPFVALEPAFPAQRVRLEVRLLSRCVCVTHLGRPRWPARICISLTSPSATQRSAVVDASPSADRQMGEDVVIPGRPRRPRGPGRGRDPRRSALEAAAVAPSSWSSSPWHRSLAAQSRRLGIGPP